MTTTVATRLISLPDISAGHLAAWRRLAERAAEPNPFFEADFVLPAIQRIGFRGAQLLVVERGGDWLACAPVRRRGAPPLGALQSLRDEYCFLGTPLVERDSVQVAVEALLGASQERHRLLVLELLAMDGPIAATVGELLESRSYQLVLERKSERGAAFRTSADQQLEQSSKERSERRRRLRRLEDELGSAVQVRDRSGSPEAIEHFLRLEAASWKGESGTALASRPADATFFRQISTAFGDAGRLRVLELSTDSGAPLAVTCDLIAGDTIFGFKTAFDEQYRRQAPGVELTIANAEDFFANRPERVLDSCSPSDSKLMNKLLPDRRQLATVVIGPRGARTALARGAARAAGAMHERRTAARRS